MTFCGSVLEEFKLALVLSETAVPKLSGSSTASRDPEKPGLLMSRCEHEQLHMVIAVIRFHSLPMSVSTFARTLVALGCRVSRHAVSRLTLAVASIGPEDDISSAVGAATMSRDSHLQWSE